MTEKKTPKTAPKPASKITPLTPEKPPKPATESYPPTSPSGYPPPEPDDSAEYKRYVREVS